MIKTNDGEEGQCVAFTLESIVVGQDGEQTTTAPVVVPVENAPHSMKPTKTKSYAKLRSIILDLAIETHTPYADDPKLRVKAAKVNAVRNEHYRQHISRDGTSDPKNCRARSSDHFTAT